MHYVDDFLLLTHDPPKAKDFFETITKGRPPDMQVLCFMLNFCKGIPEYNCFANVAKTNTNFKVNEDGSLTLDRHSKDYRHTTMRVFFHFCRRLDGMVWCSYQHDKS